MTLAHNQEPFPHSETPYPHQRPSAKYLWLLLLVMAIGLILRLTLLDGKSLWQDELYTLASATGNNLFEATVSDTDEGLPGLSEPETAQSPDYFIRPITTMQDDAHFWHALSNNIQMPAYPLLARFLIGLFGADPMMLRLVSALLGVLLIPATYWLGKQILPEVPVRRAQFGLLLATLVSVCGFQVTYSQTARVYALVTLLAVVSTAFLLELLGPYKSKDATSSPFKHAWPYWFGFTLTTALGLYTTYLYTFLLAFQVVYTLFIARPAKVFYPHMAACAALLAAVYLPWYPMYQAQQDFLKDIGHGNLTGLWKPLSLVERLWNVLAEQVTPKDIVGKLWATALIAVGIIQGIRLKEARPILWLSLLWLGALIGGLLWIDLSHQTHRILSKRYTMMASPALYMLMASGLYFMLPRWLNKPWQRVLFPVSLSISLILMTLNSLAVVSGEKFVSKENYLAASQLILSAAGPKDLVLVNHSGVHTAAMSFYLSAPNAMPLHIAGVSRKTKEHPWAVDELHQRLKPITQPYSRIWVVFTHTYGPARNAIRNWLAGAHYEEAQYKKFSGVEVYLYQR